MLRIQVITIIVTIIFLLYISWLILKAKLREEYAIIWFISTLVLLVFAFWNEGLVTLAKIAGVSVAANLVFTTFIFIILIYLLHLSVINSRLQKNITQLAQEMALLKQKLEKEQTAISDPETV